MPRYLITGKLDDTIISDKAELHSFVRDNYNVIEEVLTIDVDEMCRNILDDVAQEIYDEILKDNTQGFGSCGDDFANWLGKTLSLDFADIEWLKGELPDKMADRADRYYEDRKHD